MANIDIQVSDMGDFDEITVIGLMVKVADTVKLDQCLITAEGDKASMENPSFHGGVPKELKLKVGDKVKQGALVLVPDGEGGAAAPAPVAATRWPLVQPTWDSRSLSSSVTPRWAASA